MGDEVNRWFGAPHQLDVRAELRSRAAEPSQMDRCFEGYEALRAHAKTYSAFLEQAATCEICLKDETIREEQKPIPMLCGLGTNRSAIQKAHDDLESYRRANGSLQINPDSAGLKSLRAFLEKHQIGGLSIGHCGWSDLTARLRGAQLSEGVEVMILGADWYPLTACSNFLLDPYREDDHTLTSFLRRLRHAAKELGGELPGDPGELFRAHRIYLGNTLLCYRGGLDKTGQKNLSKKSFENCRVHLARHVDALHPRVLVTFGREPARSVAHLLRGRDDGEQATLGKLRSEPKVKKIMEERGRDWGRFDALRCVRDGDSTEREIAFVPLCHPSMPNRYERDYQRLAELLRSGSRASERILQGP